MPWGGKPLTCLAIVCFPTKKLPLGVLELILKGGRDKVSEAGAFIVGGHTIQDEQPKYGLSVTGIINPDKIVTNAKARPGDCLIITKPLGTGIVVTAAKAEIVKKADLKVAVKAMCFLNKSASEIMQAVGVNACTDVTGFSLLGHLHQMATASNVAVELDMNQIPALPGVLEYAGLGMIPEGAYDNRKWLEGIVSFDPAIAPLRRDLLFDPQTSGGLLISVGTDKAQNLLRRLRRTGLKNANIIGRITGGKQGTIKVLGQ